MAPEYLLLFAHSHFEFRLPELESVCKLLGIEISYDRENVDLSTPFMRAVLSSEDDARRLGARCISLRAIYQLWADAPNYERLFEIMQDEERARATWLPYREETSFRFRVSAYNNRPSTEYQREIIDSFRWMGYKGEIRMNNPELTVAVVEDYPETVFEHGRAIPRQLKWVWIGKKICEGQRNLIDTFDLKRRVYIGNTSMEAEMSLIMANQALAAPSKLIYDPFVGTGSMLYTSAWFGAMVMGSDIDGRHIRGREGKSVFDSAAQYGVRQRILDCAIFDLTQHPLRQGGFLDAIVTDPPYGVRAGAKRLGRKDESKIRTAPYQLPDGTYSHELDDYVPPSKPWEMSEVLTELLRQAHYLLKPGGRLVYWLPTITAEYHDSDVPTMDGMVLISNSEQSYGKWARRVSSIQELCKDISRLRHCTLLKPAAPLFSNVSKLITMEKADSHHAIDHATHSTGRSNGSLAQESTPSYPAHHEFRQAFFAQFGKKPDRPLDAASDRIAP